MPSLADTATPRNNQPCPVGSWDVHHHIFDLDRFPLASSRHFTPAPAPLACFEDFQHSMGIEHACIAHGLSFGSDLSSLLYYLDYFSGTAKAYGCIDVESTSDEELRTLKSKGIIGFRIDLHQHKAQHDCEKQIRCLQLYGARIAPFNMGLQIYHPHPEFYDRLAPVIRELQTRVVVDHFGGLKTRSLLEYQGLPFKSFDAASQPGIKAICDLMRDSKLWIKLSAPYRCSEDPTLEDMKPLVRALVDANPDRVLYGSDWPHTLPFHRRRPDMKPADVEEFLSFDDSSWVKKLRSWLSEEEWVKLMVDNPARFTGYSC